MAPPAFSPEQESYLDAFKAEINATINSKFDEILRRLAPSALPPTAPLPAPLPAPLELPPLPTPPAPPALKLPPLRQTPAYPPPPSVEALEEVECIQVYKPLRNIRKRPIRQKHRAAKSLPKAMQKTPRDAEVFEVFGNIIAWPPKFGGTNMRLSRDQHLDA